MLTLLVGDERQESGAYQEYFGLAEPPFSPTPDPRFMFESRSHSEALAGIASALGHRETLTLVTGEIGSGKTTLCRTAMQRLTQRTLASLVDNPPSGVDDLLAHVLDDFGVVDRTRIAGASVDELIGTLKRFLASLAPLQAHAVIIVDQAERVDPEILNQLRLLSDFETEGRKPLQLILVGQPALQDVLERPEMRELRQRVCRQFRLTPLATGEVRGYIENRLLAARGEPVAPLNDGPTLGHEVGVVERASASRELFTPSAIRAIARLSGGRPRVINSLGDRALEVGHNEGKRTIDTAAVCLAARELEMRIPFRYRVRSNHLKLAAAVVLVAAGAWIAARSFTGGQTTVPAGFPAAATIPSVNTPDTRVPVEPQSPEVSLPRPSESVAVDESFTIVVASFRTSTRAAAVAAEVAALGLPASTRSASGGWQQVVVGPYASRNEATEAQQRLTGAHLAGTQVTANGSAGSRSAAEPDVLMAAGPAESPNRTSPPTESVRNSPVSSFGASGTDSQGTDVLERARALAQLPDVKGIERLRADQLKRTKLADPRQDPVVVALDRSLDEARQLQLSVDARGLRQSQAEEYREAMLGMIPDLDETSAALAAWSIGAGTRPDSRASAALASRLRALEPPSEIATAHERLRLSLESLTKALASSGAADPAAQASEALAAITQAKGALQEFLRPSDGARARR